MPSKRLVVSDEAAPFIARGGRIFGMQVINADLDIREGDEILVVDRKNRVLTLAQAI